MTPLSLALVILVQVCAVTGQVIVKKASNLPASTARRKRIALMAMGITSMTIGFFTWLGLMPKYDLSYLFPFEGLHFILIVLAAAIFLKEKATLSLWLGVILISVGVALVSAT